MVKSVVKTSSDWLDNPISEQMDIVAENGRIIGESLGNAKMISEFKGLREEFKNRPDFAAMSVGTSNRFEELRKILSEVQRQLEFNS